MISIARRKEMLRYLDTQKHSVPYGANYTYHTPEELIASLPPDDRKILDRYGVSVNVLAKTLCDLNLLTPKAVPMARADFELAIFRLKGEVQLAQTEADLAAIVAATNDLVAEYTS